jgi:hypothetical protein
MGAVIEWLNQPISTTTALIGVGVAWVIGWGIAAVYMFRETR